MPSGFDDVKAIAAADANHDGVLDLLAVQESGAIVRLSNLNGVWDSGEVAQVPGGTNALTGEVRLRAADLDNNGAFDLMLTNADASHNAPGATVGWRMRTNTSRFSRLHKARCACSMQHR